MNKKQSIATLVVVLISTLTLPAQGEHPIDKFESDCLSQEGNDTTAGIANCNYEAQKKWDAELNKYYKLLMGILDKDAKSELKESQLAWIKFRNAEFKNIENIYNQMATLYIPVRAADKMRIVKERALRLKSYYDDTEDSR